MLSAKRFDFLSFNMEGWAGFERVEADKDNDENF
jgi:hypothetical protein